MSKYIVELSFFFKNIYKQTTCLIWFFYCLFYDFWNFSFSFLDLKRNKIKNDNYTSCYNFNLKKYKQNYYDFFCNFNFLNFDKIWINLFGLNYFFKSFFNKPSRVYFRVLNTKNGFYFNFLNLFNKKYFFHFLKNIFYSGYIYIWLALRFWLFPLLICFGIIYITLVLKLLPFNKILFAWISILMSSYWLISGFVFFFKKYQFGKYTSSVQRFWRRSYILFWLLEGATFGVFLFLTVNSSQESFYMFDQINIFKTHLYSWKFFFLKIFPLVFLILSTYFLIVSLKWNLFSKYSALILTLTLFLTYIVWLEFYQFYHVVNFYGNLNWVYDVDDHSWSLEQDPRRTRIVNHYVNLMFILKFWHIIFIYSFWLFFILRCIETKRIRYPMLAANYQNFIILYIFAWVFMYPWFKFFFRKFLDSPYYWFYVNNRDLFFRVIFSDFKIIYYGLLDYIYFFFNNLFFFKNSSFFYWQFSSNSNFYEVFRKHIIKDRILKCIIFIN